MNILDDWLFTIIENGHSLFENSRKMISQPTGEKVLDLTSIIQSEKHEMQVSRNLLRGKL
jgi:hypothetical protein